MLGIDQANKSIILSNQPTERKYQPGIFIPLYLKWYILELEYGYSGIIDKLPSLKNKELNIDINTQR